MNNFPKKSPSKRFAVSWEKISPLDRLVFAASIYIIGIAAAVSEEIMNRRIARVFFAFATTVCFVLVFVLADRMPREMVAAGIILGFMLATVTVFVWMSQSGHNHHNGFDE